MSVFIQDFRDHNTQILKTPVVSLQMLSSFYYVASSRFFTQNHMILVISITSEETSSSRKDGETEDGFIFFLNITLNGRNI